MSKQAESETFDPVDLFPDATEMDLRPGVDKCDKNSNCETVCPVAEVNEDFPGPKFQGPEQWRLTRKGDIEFDESVDKCLNCMRCDTACTNDVPLGQMHNVARANYVDNQMSHASREFLRNKMLANYGTLGKLGSMMPRISNAVFGLGATRWLNEKLLGFPSERSFPDFATQTFRGWWSDRGGDATSAERAREAREARGETGEDKKVAFFHGCYANYHQTEVAKSMVRLYESLGYEIAVPEQSCCGTPMFANGMLEDARGVAEGNVDTFGSLVEDGYDLIATCTSCSMALRKEYPELFDIDGVDEVAAHMFDAVEYLRVNEDLEAELAGADVDFPAMTYHAPCHGEVMGVEGIVTELLADVDGVELDDTGDVCCGLAGTYGWKDEKYDDSMEIGAEMFEAFEEAPGEVALTECPMCSAQIEHGTGYEVKHPMQLLETALVES